MTSASVPVPTTSAASARAEELGLGAAGEPLQRRVHLDDPVRAVAHEGGGRGGERELDALPQRRAAHGACGIEPGRFEEVADESGPAQSPRDGGGCLRGRRRGALDDPQRRLARAGDQAERPGTGRGPRTRPRRTGGRQLDGRLLALAGRHERQAVRAAGPVGGAVEEDCGVPTAAGTPAAPATSAAVGPPGSGAAGDAAPVGDSAATRASREASKAASGWGSVPYRACWARCRSTRATGSSGSGSGRPAPGA